MKETKIGIFGLGYVGLTTAACLLNRGFAVSGYEISERKCTLIEQGECPLQEPGVAESIRRGVEHGQFSVYSDLKEAPMPDLIIVTVGTPSDERGATNLIAVSAVFEQLSGQMESLVNQGTEIVLRSTVPPGTMTALRDRYPEFFDSVPVCFYPEFLREGTAMKDFESPPQTVIGVLQGEPLPNKLFKVFEDFSFTFEVVESVSAESLKFACNAFHALKVSFGNEIGRLVSSFGGNPNEVMQLFVKDSSLNISSKYLMPGAPYGGSCLPKDTKSIRHLSDVRGLQLNTISSCEESNNAHFSYIVAKILSFKPSRVAILGLSFKKDTDDVRESPSLELIYRLASEGLTGIRVHDYLVDPEAALGVNQSLIQRLVRDPNIQFNNDLKDTMKDAEVVVIMHNDKRYGVVERMKNVNVLNVAIWNGF